MKEKECSKKSKKILINIIFIITLFVLTIYFIFKDQSLYEIIDYIQNAKAGYLFTAVGMVLIFVCSESVIIYYLMRSIQYRVKLLSCIRYSFIGFFVSAITPSASGGQPAQMYFMKKDGIDLSISTLVLMVVTIAYKFTLIILGFMMMFTSWNFILDKASSVWGVLLLGIIINIVIVFALLFLIFKQSFAKRLIAIIIIKLGKRGWIKNYPKRVSKVLREIDKYDKGAVYLKTHIHVMLIVLFITVIQRIALFSVTFLVYKAFGLQGTSAYDIIVLQTFIAIAVDNLPLPGGLGATEWLYKIFFMDIMGLNLVIPSLVLSRGISYYFIIIGGAIITAISYFSRGKSDLR